MSQVAEITAIAWWNCFLNLQQFALALSFHHIRVSWGWTGEGSAVHFLWTWELRCQCKSLVKCVFFSWLPFFPFFSSHSAGNSLLTNALSTDFLCWSCPQIPSPSSGASWSHHTSCTSQYTTNNEVNSLSTLFPSSTGQGAPSQDMGCS